MLSTHQITSSINFHTFTFATARLAYRTLSGVADDCERIHTALLWLLHFILPALPIIAKALGLVAIPAVAMFTVLTVTGLPLCLAAFTVFAIATWAVTK